MRPKSAKTIERAIRAAAGAALMAGGAAPSEAAAALGVGTQTLGRDAALIAGPLGKSTVEAARKLLQGSALVAAQRVVTSIDDGECDGQTRLRAATTVLDRVGLGAQAQLAVTVSQQSDAELRALALEAVAALRESGELD